MSYENFITKLLNIKPSELLSVMSSSAKDGSIILKVRLKPKECFAISVIFLEKLMDIIKEN